MLLTEIFSFGLSKQPPEVGETWVHIDSPEVKAHVMGVNNNRVTFKMVMTGAQGEPKTVNMDTFFRVWKRE